MKLAWQFQYLRDMLRSGIVHFSYLKASAILNEPRHARGTLHPELIPADKQPKDSPFYTPNYSTMAYFDLDRQDWRSFNLNLLYNIDAYAMLTDVPLNEEEE